MLEKNQQSEVSLFFRFSLFDIQDQVKLVCFSFFVILFSLFVFRFSTFELGPNFVF